MLYCKRKRHYIEPFAPHYNRTSKDNMQLLLKQRFFSWFDSFDIYIGDDVFFGPNCMIATPMHPLLPEERALRPNEDGVLYDQEYAKPITVGNGCWICSNVIICGGVTIGEGCVIGAGSVVTRDVPPYSIAAGNPCKVIRKITEADSIKYKPELF